MYTGFIESGDQSEWELFSVVNNSQCGSQKRMIEKLRYTVDFKLPEEARRGNDERDRLRVEKQEAERERDRAMREKQEAEMERDKARVEKQDAEVERDRARVEKSEAEERVRVEKLKAEGEKNKARKEKQEANVEETDYQEQQQISLSMVVMLILRSINTENEIWHGC